MLSAELCWHRLCVVLPIVYHFSEIQKNISMTDFETSQLLNSWPELIQILPYIQSNLKCSVF